MLSHNLGSCGKPWLRALAVFVKGSDAVPHESLQERPRLGTTRIWRGPFFVSDNDELWGVFNCFEHRVHRTCHRCVLKVFDQTATRADHAAYVVHLTRNAAAQPRESRSRLVSADKASVESLSGTHHTEEWTPHLLLPITFSEKTNPPLFFGSDSSLSRKSCCHRESIQHGCNAQVVDTSRVD